VDGDDRAIVDVGELALERRRFDLDDVRPGMGYGHGDADVATRAEGAALDQLAGAARRHLRRACRRALILDAEGDGLRLPDDAEARSGHEHDAAVALVLVTGDQPVHGRGEAERRDLARHVVHASVGDEDGAGDAVVGNVGERRGQRREQARAVGLAVGLAGLDEAHLHAGDAAEPLRHARTASVCCMRSPTSWLGLLSMTTAATEVSGSRSSRVIDGLASASTNSASASVRTKAARVRANTSRSEIANATATAAHTT